MITISVLKLVLFGLYLLFMLMSLVSFFTIFFDSIASYGLVMAMAYGFTYGGGTFAICLGLLLLILKKNNCKCKK